MSKEKQLPEETLENFNDDLEQPKEPKPEDEELSELSSLNGNERSLMDEVLMHQPRDVQRDVRKLVEISGIEPDDPFFLILLCCRVNQILLQTAPKQLENSFDNGRRTLIGMFEEYAEKLSTAQKQYLEDSKKDILEISVGRLDNAIARVLENNNIDLKKGKFTPRVKGVIAASISSGIALLLGTGMGWSMNKAVLAKTNVYPMSAEEKVALMWALSPEGKFARKLLLWNEDLFGQECQEKVKDLGITFQIGTAKAVSGFCAVFTVPPSQREFITAE